MMKRLAIPVLAIALAGCSRSEPEPATDFNVATEETVLPEPSATPPAEPAPLPTPSEAANMSAELPPPPEPVEQDEQMLDDASASGMTARSQRPTEGSEPAAEAPPAEKQR